MAWAQILAELNLRVNKRDVEKQIADLDTGRAGETGGEKYGTSFGKTAGGKMRDGHSRAMKDTARLSAAGGRDAGGQFGSFFSAEFGKHMRIGVTKTMGGIGPLILGLSAKMAAIVTAGGVAAAALPAVAAVGAAGGAALAGAGVGAAGFGIVQSQLKDVQTARAAAEKAAAKATTPAQQQAAAAQMAQVNAQIAQMSPALQSILASETKIQATWEKFAKGLAPLFVGPVAQVATLFASLTGPLHELFASSATLATPLITGLGELARQVLPLLSQMFRATAPLIQPIMTGLTGLITGLMPGLISLLRAAQPVANAFAGVLGMLGTGLGQMLAAFAPALAASGSVLTSLGQIIAALLPALARMAGVFATTLAPVFAAFARAVQALTPFLNILAEILAGLAAAILGDLAVAFNALAQLLVAISPSLTAFARALGQVFTLLENSGVFAILGNAIMAITGPLAQLINAILNGLVPLLPLVVGFVAQLATMLAGALGQAVAALLPPLTQLATIVLQAVAQLLPVILPILTAIAAILTTALVGVVQGLAIALNAIISALPPAVLQAIVIGLLGIYGAIKLIALTQAIISGVTAGFAALRGMCLLTRVELGLLAVQQAAIATATKIWAAAQWLLNIAMSANPIALIVLALVALGAALYLAWTRSATFRDIVIGVWNAITAAFTAAVGWIAGVFNTIRTAIAGPFTTWWAANGEAIKAIWSGIWNTLTAIFTPIWNLVVAAVQLGWQLISGAFTMWSGIITATWTAFWSVLRTTAIMVWQLLVTIVQSGWTMIRGIFMVEIGILQAIWTMFWNTITAIARVLFAAFQLFIKITWDIIVAIFTVAINLLTGRWGAAWNAMYLLGVQIWNAIRAFFGASLAAFAGWWTGVWNGIAGAFRTIWNGVRTFFNGWWTGLRGMIQAAVGGIAGFLSGAWNGIKGTAVAIWGGIKNAIAAVWEGIKNIVREPVRWIADNVWNRFAGIVNTFTSFLGMGKPIPLLQLAAGGIVPQLVPGSGDRQPALLEAGETVVSRSHSRLLAPYFAAAGVPGYQLGGIIGGLVSGAKWVGGKAVAGAKAVGQVSAGLLDDLAGLAKNLAYGALKLTAQPLINTLTSALGNLPGGKTGWGQALTALPKKMFGEFMNWLGGQDAAAAGGAGASWQQLWAIVQKAGIGGLSLTSSARPGDSGSYHATGQAIDVGSWDTGSTDPNTPMNKLYQWLYSNYHGASLELIHWPYGGIKNGKDVAGSFWGNATWLAHQNHVHWAAALGGAGGGAGGGVQRWRSLVVQALAMEHLPASYAGLVLDQMQSESGGYQYAQNNTDINAQMGTPSKGLMQVIQPTFNMWHWPGTSWNIFDPLANIAAALNYSAHGKGFGRGMGQMGSMHGYAKGGAIDEPVVGLGRYSRTLYSFGEAGREWVVPDEQMPGRPGGGPAPLIGTYTTAYYGTGDTAEAMREMTWTLRRVKQGAFTRQ